MVWWGRDGLHGRLQRAGVHTTQHSTTRMYMQHRLQHRRQETDSTFWQQAACPAELDATRYAPLWTSITERERAHTKHALQHVTSSPRARGRGGVVNQGGPGRMSSPLGRRHAHHGEDASAEVRRRRRARVGASGRGSSRGRVDLRPRRHRRRGRRGTIRCASRCLG